MNRLPAIAAAALLLAVAGASLTGTAALADRAAGDRCAANLDSNGLTVYSATVPAVTPGADLRDVITSTARSLVMSGKLDRSIARSAAEAAATCLELVRS